MAECEGSEKNLTKCKLNKKIGLLGAVLKQ